MLQRKIGRSHRKLWHALQPDYLAKSVLGVDFKHLQSSGIKAILIDLDSTVVAHATYDVSAELSEYLRKQPLAIYIATNRPRSRDLKELRQDLNANGVLHPIGVIGKPFPYYYDQSAKQHGLDPKEVAMIGDRFLQDTVGANLAGMTTIHVDKLDAPVNWFDRLLSGLERRYASHLEKSYEPVTERQQDSSTT